MVETFLTAVTRGGRRIFFPASCTGSMSGRGKKNPKPAAPKRSRTMTETAAEGAKALARDPPEEPTPSLLRTKTAAETAADAAKYLKRSKKAAAAKGSLPAFAVHSCRLSCSYLWSLLQDLA